MKPRATQTTGFILGIILVLILTVALIWLVMNPPREDLRYLTLYLSITSLGSAVFGFASQKLGWWRRLPRLSYALILGYIMAGGLTLFNVWVTARLMFINQHDLALGSLLLIFAGGISVAFGYFLSNAITQALNGLVDGAERLSQGDFTTRVSIDGQDEIAHLAETFNKMAAQLEQAAEAERALDEARRNLVAWASHDLRTPLTSLRLMIDSLADGVVDDPETTDRYLRQSQNEIDRISKLINDLFELAQLDAGHLDLEFEWITISDLISDTLESFAVQAKSRGVQLRGVVAPEVDPVWAAPDKLSRILDNLLANALRHTSQGDEINLSVGLEKDWIVIQVKDTGAGIPPKDLPHIFDRFYRGESSRSTEYGGVGLGLAIVKGLVNAHHGKINVVSELGKGATFCFTLPKRKPL